jgi:hypothetical protein
LSRPIQILIQQGFHPQVVVILGFSFPIFDIARSQFVFKDSAADIDQVGVTPLAKQHVDMPTVDESVVDIAVFGFQHGLLEARVNAGVPRHGHQHQ